MSTEERIKHLEEEEEVALLKRLQSLEAEVAELRKQVTLPQPYVIYPVYPQPVVIPVTYPVVRPWYPTSIVVGTPTFDIISTGSGTNSVSSTGTFYFSDGTDGQASSGVLRVPEQPSGSGSSAITLSQ